MTKDGIKTGKTEKGGTLPKPSKPRPIKPPQGHKPKKP